MSENRIRRLPTHIALLAIVAAMGAILMSGQAEAYACKSAYTTKSGSAIIKASAMSKARTAWSSAVKAQYGLSWSVWNIAASQSQPCSSVGSKWTCSAKAKPCNYVVP